MILDFSRICDIIESNFATMKRFIILILLMKTVSFVNGQHMTLMGSNEGVAPISSFSVDEPVIMMFFKTNLADSGFWSHIEVSPDVAIKSGNELWFTELWLRGNYWAKKDTLKKTVYTVGINFPSFFGQKYTLPTGEEINQVVTYYDLQAKVTRKLSKKLSLSFEYWYLRCTDMRYGVAGHYASINGLFTQQLDNGNNFVLSVNPNLFYLDLTNKTKGLVGSLGINIIHPKTGLFAGVMGITKVTSDQVARNGNVSLGITRKIF
jgi:hypothetical protein